MTCPRPHGPQVLEPGFEPRLKSYTSNWQPPGSYYTVSTT